MRILLVLTTSTGGVGTHVASLAERLAARGHTVGVIGSAATNAQFDFEAHPRIKFVPVSFGTSLGPRDVGTVTRLKHLVSTFEADVVHAHGFRAGFLTLSAVARMPRKKRPRTIVTWHNKALATGLTGVAQRRVETYVAKHADLTLGASQDLVRIAARHGARHAVFAPAAAPEPVFSEDVNTELLRAGLVHELSLPPDALLVLAVGRIAPQKNYRMLLSAVSLIKDDHPGLRVLVAGAADETELASLSALVEEEDLPVHFLGQRGDVSELNQAADVFVLTSTWEARALVLQEAMMAGKAIVATAVGGTPELVGDAGVLVEPEDVAGLAAALDSVLSDPALRRELGEKAAAAAVELPDEDEVADIVETHYLEVCSRGRALAR